MKYTVYSLVSSHMNSKSYMVPITEYSIAGLVGSYVIFQETQKKPKTRKPKKQVSVL